MKKSVGLDVSPPKDACEDQKCPWHGTLPVRGRALTAVVRSTKSKKTAVVEWRYNKFITKYEAYERRKSRVVAYSPECMKVKEGDEVVIAECRPLSKTKTFVVVGHAVRKEKRGKKK